MTTTETEKKPIIISYLRFSTPEQEKGNSQKRQLRKSQEYAEKQGLVIDERYNLKDLGVSAFRGEHKRRGALGVFLALVEKGEIPRGSVLLIESFDRLSREKMRQSIGIFTDIVDKDIKIVTLIDGKEYGKSSDGNDWISMMSIMSRAHEESETKSIRLKDAWGDKRKDISTKKLTAISPAWLKLDRKNQQFQMITDRCKLIQRIFRLYLDGYGAGRICKLFNEEEISAWKTKTGWHTSYIQKILHSRAVMGEFQPHVMDGKKRIPAGSIIPDYFPAILTKADFYSAQERLARNVKVGGRNGKINNLFGHIAKCGYCAAPMTFVDKGIRSSQHLICDNARRGRGCDNTPWQYCEFEQEFLKRCQELDLKSILPKDYEDFDSEINALVIKKGIMVAELGGKNTQRKNLLSLLETSDDETFRGEIGGDLKENGVRAKELRAGIDEVSVELTKLIDLEKQTDMQRRNITELIKTLKDTKGDDLIAIRQKLRAEIRKLVKRIDVFPNGMKGRMKSIDSLHIQYIDMRATGGEETNREYQEYVAGTTGKHHRTMAIWFNAGGFREVFRDGDFFRIGVTGQNNDEIIMNIIKNTVTE